MKTVADQLKQRGHVQISTLTQNGVTLELHIEEHTPTEELEWDKTHSLIGDSYEMALDGVKVEEDLTHNIANVDGKVFRVPDEVESDTIEFKFISILTDRGEDGEVIVPDEPYDEGDCEIPGSGVYRVYELRRE